MTRTFKGWHMAAIMVTFFGIVIAVNLTMAVLANTSWTGLVVANSYVASQSFNHDAEIARQQQALGWKLELNVSRSATTLLVLDRSGQPIAGLNVRAVLQRPTNETGDVKLDFSDSGTTTYISRAPVNSGAWIADVTAEGPDHKPVRFVQRIMVK